jgi:hypothetical protein
LPRSPRIAGAFGATLVVLGAPACGRSDAPAARAAASGEQLAARYCQRCHLLPAPALLDKTTWDQWVLPRMARRLGLRGIGDPAHAEAVEGGAGRRLVRAAGVFPDSAQLSRAEWDRLAAHYLREAPAALPAGDAPAVADGLPGFRVRVADFRVTSPMVTLVQVDPRGGRIYVGEGTPGRGTLAVLDGRGRTVASHALPSPVSHLRVAGDTLGVVFMGQLNPSEVPRGTLALVSAWRPGAAPAVAWKVDALQRPVFASYGDLSGDGVEDVVVSEFGHLTGRLAWYERLPGGGSRRHLLSAQPGAQATAVRDVDGDGRADVVALTGQGDEGVWLFRGRPGGGFSREPLVRFPPSYGSTGMELADVNGDGHADIVHTNGDNGDYPSPRKPYHGVRVFLNDGRWRFAERYFFPMAGAFKTVARDFDGDGDVDLATIAFYPDYTSAAPLAFAYLENRGGTRFAARTFADADRGRWLTMDAGDVDRDGDDDLVLGSFAQLDAQGDERGRAARWRRPDAPTVLILENTGPARRARPRAAD